MSRLIRGVRVLDPGASRDERCDVAVRGSGEDLDGTDLVLTPAFVDLVASRAGPADDAAANAGGFGTCLGRPGSEASANRLACGALTVDSSGLELADMATAVAGGAVALSDDSRSIPSGRTLLAALTYAAGLDVPVFLRPSDPDLEGGGLTRSGTHAVQLGLPGVPPEAESLGVHRAAQLARLSGCRVHLTSIWSAAGVEALAYEKPRTPGLTASTTPLHLTQRPERIAELHYAGWARIHPPVGDDADRSALAMALRNGLIDAVATHHRRVLRHEQDCELGLATPGTLVQPAAFGLVHRATGCLETSVRCLGDGPRRVLGLSEATEWALIAPADRYQVSDGPTALAGESVHGRVLELVSLA